MVLEEAGRGDLLGDVHSPRHLLKARGRVGLVVDDELGVEAESADLSPEDADTGRMEGRNPEAVGLGPKQRGDPAPHLLGGLVGEGHRQKLPGLADALCDEPGDPVGDDLRLAASRPGEDEERALVVEDRL